MLSNILYLHWSKDQREIIIEARADNKMSDDIWIDIEYDILQIAAIFLPSKIDNGAKF